MLQILAGSMNKTAAEVAAESPQTRQKLRGLRVLHAVLAANTAGRAKVIVREDTTKNGAWAWAKLHEKFGRDSGATSFTELNLYSWPREREAVRRRMARVGQEGLEASTRVTALTSN